MSRAMPITFICAFRDTEGRLVCQLPAAWYVLPIAGDIEERVFCEKHADIMAARS